MPILILLIFLFILLLIFNLTIPLLIPFLLILRLISLPLPFLSSHTLPLSIPLHPLSRIINHLNILILTPGPTNTARTGRPSHHSITPAINARFLRLALPGLDLRIRLELLLQSWAEGIEFQFGEGAEYVRGGDGAF